MAYDAFLKIDVIPGESLDAKHKDWIEVLSFSWGVSQPHSSSGQFTGHVVPEDFTFTHAVDKSSPKLMLACAEGDAINEVDVAFRKAGSGGGGIDYLKYSFFDVFFSSVRPGGQSVAQQLKIEDALPFEEVTFTYGKVEINYQQLDSRGRLVGAPIQSALDFENIGSVAGTTPQRKG
jgi:type VI secretion system secreted protein Hcp